MTDQNPSSKEPKKDSEGKRSRKRKPLPEEGFDWWKATRTITIWALLFIVSWIVFQQLNVDEKPEVRKSYTQYRNYLQAGQIDGAEIIEREFHGRLKDGGAIVAVLPFIDQGMLAEWDSLKIDYQFKEKTTSWFGIFLINILPWVVIFGFWIYLMRRMQGGGGARGVFSFGKSKAKLSLEGKPKITFEDVAGCDEAKTELQEVIAFLRDPKKFTKLGGRIPKGALLLGPPGTGKTLLARAVAGEAEVPFFSMSGADFVEMFVGVGAARVRDLFETGKKHAPCIIFIDEIDAVGRHRGAGLGGGHDEREQTLNQLLVEMDGFEGNDGVILIAATNRPDVLDPALTRPGRFDRQIVVDRPDVRGREGILKVHTRQIPLASDVKLEVLAKGTPGLAGAELANLVNEAALLAARRNGTQVTMLDFEEAKDKVMMGTERKSLLISEDEKRQTAYHEAGHVLVAKLTPGADPVHKVTIIPRGRALGLTHYLPLDEKHNYSRNYLKQTLTHLMGGRVAEKIVFNEFSTGAGNDIERATDIARRMVCEWGMSDRFGPISFGKRQEEIFLGREISQHRDFSERTAQDIDIEVRKIVTDAEQNAERILKQNLDKLKVVAEALLEREILDGEEIDILLRGGKLPPQHLKVLDAPPYRSGQQRGNQPRRDGRDNRDQRGPQQQPRPGQGPRIDQPRGGSDRPDRPRFDQNRSGQPHQDSSRPSQPSRPEPLRVDPPRSEPLRVDPPRPEPLKVEPPRTDQPRTDTSRSDRPRSDQPAGERSRSNDPSRSPGRMRRDFAKSMGVASSRDPENRRPTPMEISKMRQAQLARQAKEEEPGKPADVKPEVRVEQPPQPQSRPEPRPPRQHEPRRESHREPLPRLVVEPKIEPKPEVQEERREVKYEYHPEPLADLSTTTPPPPPRREREAAPPPPPPPPVETVPLSLEIPDGQPEGAAKPAEEGRRQGRFRSYRSRERRPRREGDGSAPPEEGTTGAPHTDKPEVTPPPLISQPQVESAKPSGSEPAPAPDEGSDERAAARRRSRSRRPRQTKRPGDGTGTESSGSTDAPRPDNQGGGESLFSGGDRSDGD